MAESESWLERMRQQRLFRDSSDSRQMAKHMLDINDTNKVITEKQAVLLTELRLAHANVTGNLGVLGRDYNPDDDGDDWSWMSSLADMIERYQMSCGKPVNNRKEFIEALKVELQAQEVKKKQVWSL